MAKKKTNSRKKKSSKKNYSLNIIIACLCIALLVCGGIWVYNNYGHKKDSTTTTTPSTSTTPTESITNTSSGGSTDEKISSGITYDDFQIHFLELGNSYAGDSVYVKYNDIDILIDAGSRKDSADDIISYFNSHSNDQELDYVIATHGHQDHIAGFVGNSSASIFDDCNIKYIIDYSLTNSDSQIGKDYVTKRDAAVSRGAVRYSVDSFFEEGKSNVIEIDENFKITILYNYYYFNKSIDENNYSVCTLLTYKDHNFMMTGDLEKEGEEKIAEYYDGSSAEKTLPHCELFKAGHHGSKTSSNDCLLSLITPEISVVCCCAGSTEYTTNYENIFPTQEYIDRIAKYTDLVYVTTYFDFKSKTFKSLNGDITISSNGTNIGINCSNSNEVLKNSEWFNETIYVVNGQIPKQSAEQYNENTPNAIAVPRRVWPSYGK